MLDSKLLAPVVCFAQLVYSHLFDKRGGWNKREGGAKVAKSLNVEVGINVEGGIFWKKLVYKCNKRGGWMFFSKSISVTPRLLER